MYTKPEYRFQNQPDAIMKAARQTSGLSESDVANAIGCTAAEILQMEGGVEIPSCTQWYLFCHLVKISTDSFYVGYSRGEHGTALGFSHASPATD